MKTTATILETVQWTPGLPYGDRPHVVAADKEGLWVPSPGYTWVTDEKTDLSVRPVLTKSP